LKFLGALALLLAILVGLAWWYFHPGSEVRSGIVYTQRDGVDLTYEVVAPNDPNGAAVLLMVSGSWKSGADKFRPWLAAPLLRRGLTVVAISHLSQPKATVDEIVEDVNRAVRHVRYHAADHNLDANRFGVTGGSSGGHLSLMLATRASNGPVDAEDPIDRISSRIQAAAVFFPVTDLVDLGPSTQNPGDGGPPMSFVKGFGFQGRPDDPRRIPPADLAEWKKLAHELSPIQHISANLPPVLIHHGDADTLVPLDQSERFLSEAKQRGVGERVELVIHEGGRHGWLTMLWDVRQFAEWFDWKLTTSAAID
jgi:acetyl esterase/lipase